MTYLRLTNTEVITTVNQIVTAVSGNLLQNITNVSGSLISIIPQQVLSHESIIPAPHLITFNGGEAIAVKWMNENKEFLNYDPKYYLFRYRGVGRHKLSGQHVVRRKGFFHPTHRNGSSPLNKAWWGGADHDRDGHVMPARDTEWELPAEGVELPLSINFNDWIYSMTGHLPVDRSDVKVRGGGSKYAFAAYFCIAIGIHQSDITTGCPITFGPKSEIFSIKPRNNIGGSGTFNSFGWFIGT
jgi:hypothetical protein